MTGSTRPVLDSRNTRVGGSQINTDDSSVVFLCRRLVVCSNEVAGREEADDGEQDECYQR